MSVSAMCTTARVIDDSLMNHDDIMDKPFWKPCCAHDVAHQVTVKFANAQWVSVVSKCVNVLLVLGMANGIFIDMTTQGNVLLAMPARQLCIPKNEVDSIILFCGGLDSEDGRLTMLTWATCYLLGVTVVVMESVKDIHADWPILRYLFDFPGFEVRWVRNCDLREKCPNSMRVCWLLRLLVQLQG